MKKRSIYYILAAIVLLAGLSGCGKSDNGGADTSPTDLSTPAPSTPTPDPQPVAELSLCGIPVVMNSQPTGTGYKGASYEDGVLTIEGVDMLADTGTNPAISFAGDLEIVLVGENRIVSENELSAIIGAVTNDGKSSNLIFSGDGSLVIEIAGDAGHGIECSGTITVMGGEIEINGIESALSGYVGEGEQLRFTEGFGIVGEHTEARVVIGAAE